MWRGEEGSPHKGHSSLRMLQRYAHIIKGIWRSTIQILGRDSTVANPTPAALKIGVFFAPPLFCPLHPFTDIYIVSE